MTDRHTPYDVSFVPINDFKISQHIGIAKPLQEQAVHIEKLYKTITNQYLLN